VDGPSSATDKTISWRREGGVYTGADGGFPNQVSSGGVGPANAVVAFASSANAPISSADAGAQKIVQYFADARNVMPAVSSASFNVVWTVAEGP
jgi:hypothetical protein